MSEQLKTYSVELLKLIEVLPDSEAHIHICPIDGCYSVTTEWLSGSFCGRAFDSKVSYLDCVEQMIEYFNKELNSDKSTMMKSALVKSGYPNLTEMKHYCESFFEDIEEQHQP